MTKRDYGRIEDAITVLSAKTTKYRGRARQKVANQFYTIETVFLEMVREYTGRMLEVLEEATVKATPPPEERMLRNAALAAAQRAVATALALFLEDTIMETFENETGETLIDALLEIQDDTISRITADAVATDLRGAPLPSKKSAN